MIVRRIWIVKGSEGMAAFVSEELANKYVDELLKTDELHTIKIEAIPLIKEL